MTSAALIAQPIDDAHANDIRNGWASHADLPTARMLPHLRARYRQPRPPWVDARVDAMVASGEWDF